MITFIYKGYEYIFNNKSQTNKKDSLFFKTDDYYDRHVYISQYTT